MSSPASPAADPLLLSFGPFELDEANARLSREGRALAVAPRPFAVLCCLARRPGQLVTKDALLDAVWGHHWVSESVLKTTISDLRTILGDDARQPRFIETAARRGYRFIGAQSASAPADAMPPSAGTPVVPACDAGSGFVGREQELRELHAAWLRAQSGQRQLLWLSGEAGIGKSTLLEQFAGEARPPMKAHGQCVEQRGAGEPYLPVLEALAGLCRADPSLAAVLREVAPTWYTQLPWLVGEDEREALRRELAGAGQDRMLREMGEWLDRVSAERALLLVTEDLHWSDDATVRLIDHVARRRSPARLMWIATFRSAELAEGEHPMRSARHELRLHRLATEMVLAPFTAAQVADFAARHGSALPQPLADELHRRTDGLPLFVASVLDDFAAQGTDAPEAVPESLAAVIERRIEGLPEQDVMLLEAASVVGVEFPSGVVAQLLGLPAEDVLARLELLARRQQWIANVEVARAPDGALEGRCHFRHALVRQVLYQRVGVLRRAQWHLAVARALAQRREGGSVTAAELALHFERGHDVAAAMRHYVEAAEAALARYAHVEAMRLARQGLDLLSRDAAGVERDEREMALLAAWTVAASQVQGVTAPATHAAYQRIDALGPRLPVRPSRGLELGLGWVEFVRGDYESAVARAQQAHEWGVERDDPLLLVTASHLSGAVRTFQGRLQEARQALEEGVEIGCTLSDRLELAKSVVDLGTSMHARLAHVYAHLGLAGRAREQIALAEARAAANGQPYARRLVLVFASFIELRLERPRAVQTLAETLQQLATEHGIRQAEGPARWLRGWALTQLGDPLSGHALILEGYALDSQIEMRRGRSGVLGYAAQASLLAGRFDDAQRELDEAFALAEQMGERLSQPDLWLTRARLARALGDRIAAASAARAGLEEARTQQAHWLELAAQADWCENEGTDDAALTALRDILGRVDQAVESPLLARVQALLHDAT
ncbi:AAA family ATPase [Variovorax sp. OV329]|uniref:ATP-binding protein n=1 Tax=Variovorax sp. OV329 TaxID=1882825 RepID=UPI0008F3EA09|nr:AAA family ATPase [Variovorax sp. OV329]SFL92019.1 Transcriptional regulatory protein, C terminal [Variovorax sp. OV329]